MSVNNIILQKSMHLSLDKALKKYRVNQDSQIFPVAKFSHISPAGLLQVAQELGAGVGNGHQGQVSRLTKLYQVKFIQY